MLKIDNRIWLTASEQNRLATMTGHFGKVTTLEQLQAVLNHAADRLEAGGQRSACGEFDTSGAAELRLYAAFVDQLCVVPD